MIPFNIYTRKQDQTRFKRHCKYQKPFELVNRNNRFLPFIIKRSTHSNQIKSWRVYDLNDNLKYVINPASTSYEIFTNGSVQYLVYYGAQISGLTMDCGEYYLKISDNVTTWYSEVFTVKDFNASTNPYHILEWKHLHDLGDIIYQTGYINRLFLNIELGEPEYEIEEEVLKDINGNEVETLVRTRKVYKTVIPELPEYIVDSLSLTLQGASEITITLPENVGTISNIKQARVESTWVNDGCAANVQITFKLEESIIKKTCHDNDELTQVEVLEPDDPNIVLVSITNESGENQNDGSFTVSVTNYLEPEFSLDGETWQTSGTFTGLGAGTYTVHVRVESGKIGTIDVTIYENIDCSEYQGATIQDLIDNGILWGQLYNCTLGDLQ
jgi:hypothetical protein